jgi:DNA-binding XRE family transcriptional regulator
MSKAVGAQKIVTPAGETMVVLPLAEYEALREAAEDAADIAAANEVMTAFAEGQEEFIPSAMVDRLLDSGESRIRIWREYRGLTGAALAKEADVSAAYLSELEAGKKTGSVAALARIAAALGLTVDDLI